MKHILLYILLVFVPLVSIAQKRLTLGDAVMGQYQKYLPERILDFHFLDEGQYAYLEMYRTLIIKDREGKLIQAISIQDVNQDLSTSFSYFAELKWKNNEEILLQQGEKIALYNIKKKTGVTITLPEEAENISFDKSLNYVAYTIDNNLYYSPVNEFKQFVVTQFYDENIVSGQTISRSEMGIDGGIFWSPSGKYLAFYQKDESAVHDYPLLDNSAYPGELKSIKYPMAGQASEKVKVGIYDLEKGEVSYISPLNGEDYYLTNLAWMPDEKNLLIVEVARSQKHIWMQKYSSKGEFQKTLFEETALTWVEPERPTFFPSTSSNNFVWITEKDGFDNLYYYNEEGLLIRQLTQNQFPIKNIVTARNNEIYFTATGECFLNTLLYKVNFKGKQMLLTKEEGTHQVKVSEDGKYIFDQFSAHDVPNKAQILTSNGKVVKELLVADNPYDGFDFTEAEIKKIQNKSGTDLYTRMIKPRNFDPTKKYPVMIYVYGGPHAQLITNSWLDGANLWMYWMADQDYLVFTLDNRGSANRGAEFEHIIHRQLGVAEFEDQMDGVEYLKSLPYVDAERIAVHGWSFGGFMTTTMLLKAPDAFTVGVAGGAVTDWKYYEIMYGERYMDSPQDNPEGYAKTSLLNQAENLKSKLLLIHGTVDPVVVMQHTLSLVQKFVDLGIQIDYFPYPMHEHNVLGRDRVHLMRKVLTYIIENNK